METPSICLYTNVFTLKSRSPQNNQYLQMYLLWLSQVLAAKVLTPKDKYIAYIDSDSIEHLKETVFYKLLEAFPCPVKILLFPPPETFEEGCCNRFRISSAFEENILMYCDIDILLLKPIGKLFEEETTKPTLYLHAEGQLKDINYGAHYLKKGETIHDNFPGFSSGKFAIRGKDLALHLFSCIQQEVKDLTDVEYYCLDQAIFNYVALKYCKIDLLNMILFSKPLICTNFIDYDSKKVIMLDLMGEPGNEMFHMEKVINAISLFYAGLNL